MSVCIFSGGIPIVKSSWPFLTADVVNFSEDKKDGNVDWKKEGTGVFGDLKVGLPFHIH
jgi:hypothetical protein